MSDNDNNEMKLMGEAPRLVPILLPLLAAAIAATALWPRVLSFEGIWRGPLLAVGIELAALGLLFWADAAWRLLRAWKRKEVATRGAYGLCRNPIFAWWIFFVLPPAALIADSWAFLLLGIVLWFVANPAADREEEAMEARFGSDYGAYRQRVRRFLPVPYLRPFRIRRYAKALGCLVLLGFFCLGVYLAVVKPVMAGLGATREERLAAMAGDELVAGPEISYTQAIDIDASAEETWAWLVQVGCRRAGWYNVDAINRLAAPDYFIDGTSSSVRIHPELQNLAVGDRIDLVPQMGMTVVRLERPRLLVLSGDPAHPEAEGNVSWTYTIIPRGPEACRLVTRFQGDLPAAFLPRLAFSIVDDLGGAMLQQPAMLRGLRARAELWHEPATGR